MGLVGALVGAHVGPAGAAFGSRVGGGGRLALVLVLAFPAGICSHEGLKGVHHRKLPSLGCLLLCKGRLQVAGLVSEGSFLLLCLHQSHVISHQAALI